jgi:hypothetical protein
LGNIASVRLPGSAYPAATGVAAKQLVVANAALAFADTNYNLAQAALKVPPARVSSYLTIEMDFGAMSPDFSAVETALHSGDTAAAAALISGKLATDYASLKAACGSAPGAS